MIVGSACGVYSYEKLHVHSRTEAVVKYFNR
jgi:DNA-binding NarL/FixJ family response regulator